MSPRFINKRLTAGLPDDTRRRLEGCASEPRPEYMDGLKLSNRESGMTWNSEFAES